MVAKKKSSTAKRKKTPLKNSRADIAAREERFCYEYVLHLNATKAAINAGYSEKTARSKGSQLLTKVNIKERIEYMQSNLAETAQISAIKVLREHEKIAFSSIAHLHQTWIELEDFNKLTDDQKACIKSISTKTIKRNIVVDGSEEPQVVDVEFVKIELYDKQKSLDSINQMLGYNAPTKQELTGKDGKDLVVPARVLTKKEAAELLQELENKC